MEKAEPRARFSGGAGPTLERVGGLGRRDLNDAALRAFADRWDLARCPPAAEAAATAAATAAAGQGKGRARGAADKKAGKAGGCSGPVRYSDPAYPAAGLAEALQHASGTRWPAEAAVSSRGAAAGSPLNSQAGGGDEWGQGYVRT